MSIDYCHSKSPSRKIRDYHPLPFSLIRSLESRPSCLDRRSVRIFLPRSSRSQISTSRRIPLDSIRAAMEVSAVARQASAAGTEMLMLPVRSRVQHLPARQRRRIAFPVSGVPSRAVAAVPRCRRRPAAIRAAIRSEVASDIAKKAPSRKESPRRLTVCSLSSSLGFLLEGSSKEDDGIPWMDEKF